jgi:hypothetical protein
MPNTPGTGNTQEANALPTDAAGLRSFEGAEGRPTLFPAGNGACAGTAFAAFQPTSLGAASSFPSFAASFPSETPARMEAFSSFQAPKQEQDPVATSAREGEHLGRRVLLRSQDVMDEALCASTFGHARLPGDEEHEPRAHGAQRGSASDEGKGGSIAGVGQGQVGQRPVFRVELSSSSDDEDHKRKKKHKKKGKDKKREHHHRKERHRERDQMAGRGRETERERELREDEEARQLKRRKRDDKIDEVNPHHRISMHDIWKANTHKPAAASSGAAVSASAVMFFDRFGDAGNLEYGHPFKLEIPTYATEWFWSGRHLGVSALARLSRAACAGAAATTAKRAWNSTAFPPKLFPPKLPVQAERGGAGRSGGTEEAETACWRKRAAARRSMLGIPRGQVRFPAATPARKSPASNAKEPCIVGQP